MSGLKPPRDWLQKQKKAFISKLLLANSLIFLAGLIAHLWFIGLNGACHK